MAIRDWTLASAAVLMLAPAAYGQDSGTANQDAGQSVPGQSEPGAEGMAIDQQQPDLEGNKELDTAVEGQPASPEEEMQPAAGTTLPDAEFARDVASSNQFEILSSRMALEHAESQDVRDFARQMIDDHTLAGHQFAEARDPSVSTSSGSMATGTDALRGKHRQALAALEDAEGAEFDRLYIRMQDKAHEEAVREFRAYSQTGTDDELRHFAADTLPTLEEHWREIRAIDERV